MVACGMEVSKFRAAALEHMCQSPSAIFTSGNGSAGLNLSFGKCFFLGNKRGKFSSQIQSRRAATSSSSGGPVAAEGIPKCVEIINCKWCRQFAGATPGTVTVDDGHFHSSLRPRRPSVVAKSSKVRHSMRCKAQETVAVPSDNEKQDSTIGQDRLLKVPASNIRNFSIIAHIDHGKSTLVDKLLQITGTVEDRHVKEPFLERERGITSKLHQAARMRCTGKDGEVYCLNLIDLPGHVDFTYEVSRSLAACEGALLVVDASQGVEAQTLANIYLALENDLEIIPVLNRTDLPGAEPDRVLKEIEEVIGLDCTRAIMCNAQEGIGIHEILHAVIDRVPAPKNTVDQPLRALIFDSYYDAYRGVIVYFRVVDGHVEQGDVVQFMANGKDYQVTEVGVLSPSQTSVECLRAGEDYIEVGDSDLKVGYLVASIKSVADARVGDTITCKTREAGKALPGYQEVVPMVFRGLFPTDADQFPVLREALRRLQLNDAALDFEPETSSAMGLGFRCGFLGLLHMEIVQERLEREYNLSLITTAPSVVYQVKCTDGRMIECSNPSQLPEPGLRRGIEEPYVMMDMIAPKEYTGPLMELARERRGILKEMKYLAESRASLVYELPLGELVGDFFDQLKSRSKGFASMEYKLLGYRESDLVRLDIHINGEPVDPLATIVHKEKAYTVGRSLTKKLKELIPKQLFKIPIQACVGSKVIASEATSAMQEDVLAKCYGKAYQARPFAASNGVFDKHVELSEAGVDQPLEQQEGNGLAGPVISVTDGIASWVVKVWKDVLSILPHGSWWDVGEKVSRDKAYISFKEAMVRLWDLVSPDKLVIATAFTALVIAALSEITIPHFVAASIFSAQSGMTDQFYKNVKLLAAMSCIYGLFSGIRGGCFGVVNQILVRRMREKLFANLLNQDIAFFDTEAVGTLTSRLGSDCQQVSRIIGNDLNVMFRNGLQGAGAFVYLVTLSRHMALSTFSICAIMWLCMRFYGRYQKNTARVAQDTIALANEVAEETLALARVVRTFGTEANERARYHKWSKKLTSINFRQNVAYAFWTWSSNTLYNATQVVALLIGGGYVMSGGITPEQLTTFVLYSEWVMHSVWWVGDHWGSLMQAIGASEKVFNLLDLPPSQQLSAKGCTLPVVTGRIQFKNIWFYYPARPQVPVLRNVNLSIYPGEIIAVIGLSGSGKSTIVSLLLRHYEPSQGEVVIDGVSLTDLDVQWFRSQLGVVNQEPRLFTMDVASNISYGCPKNVTHAEIERAAKQANAHDFIMALPDRYKTVVDNTRLSGGQKQRIAIARAILRDPAILVLDEATSALDSESEHLVQKALDRAMCGDGQRRRTVLVIAHRLSTIRAADRIIVMHHGQIVETGSHDELIQLNGAYTRLMRRQGGSLSQVGAAKGPIFQ